MEQAQYHPAMMPILLESKILGDDFFTVIDVGCSGGLNQIWRLFGERLRAVGADPQRAECRRLEKTETNPNVRYHPCWIGLPPEHPFHLNAPKKGDVVRRYLMGNGNRYSSAFARELKLQAPSQSNTLGDELTTDRVSVADLAQRMGFSDVDFIKIDTDGGDLEATLSCEKLIRSANVLGFLIESPFGGTPDETSNSFHNIDRFMKRQGFALYNLSTHRYSRRDLPSRFMLPILAQTEFGQLIWGDALYFRDGASPRYLDFWGEDLSVAKLAKLACLYELCGLPDCAAELINARRERFAAFVDPVRLLDALVPPVRGARPSYDQYVKRFREDVGSFLPREPHAKSWRNLVPRGIRKAIRTLRG